MYVTVTPLLVWPSQYIAYRTREMVLLIALMCNWKPHCKAMLFFPETQEKKVQDVESVLSLECNENGLTMHMNQ